MSNSRPLEKFENFSIIAHIDRGVHFADRMWRATHKSSIARKKSNRVLDKLDLEQEKDTTIATSL